MAGFTIELDINPKLFLRNPQHSPLGRRILQHSIILIDEIGFERFTFRKLAERISSAEASVYRYFENKHLLLLYLVNWYWEWMKFRIDYKSMNVRDPRERLNIAISAIVDAAQRNAHIEFVDEDILHRIVVTEGIKAYHSKEVDAHNREGFFLSYKSLCHKISDIILEIDPEFPYPRTLASNLLEMANNQRYFSEHLPRLTDIKSNSDAVLPEQIESLLCFFAFQLIDRPRPKGTASNSSASQLGGKSTVDGNNGSRPGES